MKVSEVQELVGRVAAVDAGCADWAVLQSAVGELRRLRSWLDGREVMLAGLIAGVSSFPEKSLAEAGRTSLRNASVGTDDTQTARRGGADPRGNR